MVKQREDVERLGPYGWAVIAVVTFIALVPIYWVAAMSVRPYEEWFSTPVRILPSYLSEESWVAIFDPRTAAEVRPQYEEFVAFAPAIKAIGDSALIAVSATAIALTLGMLAAFAVSRHRFGGNFFPLAILSVAIFPPVIYVVPFILLFGGFGLIDTHLALILAYSALTTPWAMWIIRGFMDDVPRELEESAMLEGLSSLAAHFRISLPLIKGGLAAAALFVFIINWSEYLIALTLIYGDVLTIPVLMSRYVRLQEASAFYGPQAALAIIAIIPIVILTYIIRKYLVAGQTFGAVRGLK